MKRFLTACMMLCIVLASPHLSAEPDYDIGIETAIYEDTMSQDSETTFNVSVETNVDSTFSVEYLSMPDVVAVQLSTSKVPDYFYTRYDLPNDSRNFNILSKYPVPLYYPPAAKYKC